MVPLQIFVCKRHVKDGKNGLSGKESRAAHWPSVSLTLWLFDGSHICAGRLLFYFYGAGL